LHVEEAKGTENRLCPCTYTDCHCTELNNSADFDFIALTDTFHNFGYINHFSFVCVVQTIEFRAKP